MSDDDRSFTPRSFEPRGADEPDAVRSDELGGVVDDLLDEREATDPGSADAQGPAGDASDRETAVSDERPAPPPSAPPPPAPPADPNADAIARAGLAPDMAEWLREVARQVDPRLDRVAAGWRSRPTAGVARACVFGLMLGRLGNDYPHTVTELDAVAEAHPSFTTLTTGSRLATLREIAADPGRGAAWVGPLVGLEADPSPLRTLLD